MPEEIDYEVAKEEEGKEELPDSSGTLIDRFFWWGWRNVLPQWMHGDRALATAVMDQVWIDCPWCLFMRGVFLGALPFASCVIIMALIALWR